MQITYLWQRKLGQISFSAAPVQAMIDKPAYITLYKCKGKILYKSFWILPLPTDSLFDKRILMSLPPNAFIFLRIDALWEFGRMYTCLYIRIHRNTYIFHTIHIFKSLCETLKWIPKFSGSSKLASCTLDDVYLKNAERKDAKILIVPDLEMIKQMETCILVFF